jgi:hypothetical protein
LGTPSASVRWEINLNKCSWYILRWEWNKGCPILRKALPSDLQLTLCQGNNADPVSIPQKSPEMSSKMLGVHLKPSATSPITFVLSELRPTNTPFIFYPHASPQPTLTFSAALSTLELGGIGLYDLWTEAGLEAFKVFRNALFTDSEPGNLIRMNLAYSQREAGIGHALLQHPGIHLP